VVEVGQPAPQFTLFGEGNKEVTLADFHGQNLVLFFFPRAFTGTCERQLVEHARAGDQFAALGAKVVGVSTDHVPSLQKFAEHCEAAGKVTLLSDFRRKAVEAYGVAVESGPLPNQRAVFIIDREGTIRYAHVEPNPGQFQGVEPELEALQQIEGGGTL
jgi:glutaredoxin-dependent peroxiredoxin